MTLKPEDLREKVARVIGSYVVHDDKGGPDTEVLHDVIGGDYDEATRRVYELTDAILALLSPADGWGLVPVDPDGAMKMAGCAAPRSEATKAATNTLERQMETVADIYRAMLAAAPPPPGGQG